MVRRTIVGGYVVDKFKIGSRVRVVVDSVRGSGFSVKEGLINKVGTVIGLDGDALSFLVEFDEHIDGHDGNGLGDVVGKDGHCYWLSDEDLDVLSGSLLNQICQTLGVSVREEWLGSDGITYRLDGDGTIHYYNEDIGWRKLESYERILSGEVKPVWVPVKGDEYFVPNIAKNSVERSRRAVWAGRAVDHWYYNNDLMFKTKEEAIVCTNSMLEAVRKEQQ